MALLVFALILILILGLCLYLVDIVPLDPRLRIAAKIIIIIIAIIALASRAGMV